MPRIDFNDRWSVSPKTSIFAQLGGATPDPTMVTLPHDALRDEPRSPDGLGKAAYAPRSAAFEYRKQFEVPESYRGRRLALEVHGAYRDAMVFVNGNYAAQRPYGYSQFTVELDDFVEYGAANEIRIDVRAHDDSRWYTGAGITRDVVLLVTDRVHVSHVHLTTPDIDDERAVVAVETAVANDDTTVNTVTVTTLIRDADGALVAETSAPVTLRSATEQTVRQRLYVTSPHRWDVDTPYLYSTHVTIRAGDTVLDERITPLGIRSLRLDPQHGLRINDRTVKLRGACIHHDNGLLGAAAPKRAEERRVQLLKEAGFNAIRSSHNPISNAMLDACDRMGMLVMDETFDIWTEGKSNFDYALSFPEWWERDVEAMVEKDINHPSVIFYSIGNEIPETGQQLGSIWGRQLAEKVRALDGTRFVTNGINGFVSALTEVVKRMPARDSAAEGVNDAMSSFGDMMNTISASPLVTAKTEESFSVLDVAGMNYGDGRYELDAAQFPDRIIVGTETFPSRIDVLWKLVTDNPHVIGDFTWTGWDYLGEVGIGRTRYTADTPEFEAPYPWRTAWSGDLDITGRRRTVSFYREIVYGLRAEPYIAVHRPETYGRDRVPGGWAWSDSLNSWTWSVPAGTPITIDVYSDAEYVDLHRNGEFIGRRPAGPNNRYLASFDTTFEPGALTATGIRNDTAAETTSLRTATEAAAVHVHPDHADLTGDGTDLSFITIELHDASGTLVTDADRSVHVTVTGPGELIGLGTGQPDSDEPFNGTRCTSFNGALQAIIRPDGPGAITVRVAADNLPAAECRLTVVDTGRDHTMAATASTTEGTNLPS